MISEPEYLACDAVAMAARLRAGDWQASDLVETALARIERINPALNALVAVYAERARDQIADAQVARTQGPLAGVPFLMKDIGAAIAGMPTRRGSRFFDASVAIENSEHFDRLEKAGLVTLGRTNTCELGLSLTCEPRLYGPTRNPWDPDIIPGGSSGGSAAAVAAGLVPVAHATDGFGSIRVPAACCGLFGLKPTRGRNTLAPGPGESMGGLAAEHVVTRSVRDSAALLDVTSGMGTGDPYTAPSQPGAFLNEVGRNPERLKIALCSGRGLGLEVEDCQANAALKMAERLGALGHDVEEMDPPVEPFVAWQAFRTIMAVNVTVTLSSHPEGRTVMPHDVEPITWAAFSAGKDTDGEAYLRAVQLGHALGRAMGRFYRQFDMLLTPMLAHAPPPPGRLDMGNDDADAYWEGIFRFCPFAVWANLAGLPAAAIPLAESQAGVPRSVQLIAPFGEEARLFRLAGQIEAAHPWDHLRPAASW
jgi:Asp-tRNA(Asn)/Glu-tRNA(Gln) amidotransferase A subunit family amidase